MLGIGISLWKRAVAGQAGGGGSELPTFAYQSETDTLTARYAATVTTGRKWTWDWTIRRLKDAGVYSKITAGWFLANKTEADSLINFKSTSYTATKTSTPTRTANVGWLTDAETKYLDTGFNPSTAGVSNTSFHIACFSWDAALKDANDLGIVSGSDGISLNMGASTSTGAIQFRANSGGQITASNVSTGQGFVLVVVNSGTATVYYNGKEVYSGAITVSSPVNGNLYILKANGQSIFGGRTLGYVGIGSALTAQEALDYYAIIHSHMEYERGGHLNINPQGYAPAAVSAQVVVYGLTTQGCLAAYEAARQGKTVALVGGWRDRQPGGMSANGISVLDVTNTASIGGLPRLLLTRINQGMSRADTTYSFQPRLWLRALRSLLDGERTDGAGLNIPIYWSEGLDTVSKSGAAITSFTTVDGRTFTGSQFIDATYEGDLLAEAGCSYIIGREAAGSGDDALNGERNTVTTDSGDQSQFRLTSTFYNVDPYITPGVSGSGNIAYVNTPSGLPTGTADNKIQAYNFRLHTSTGSRFRADISSTPPTGYAKSNYEQTLRFLALLTADGKVCGTDYNMTGGGGHLTMLYTPAVDTNWSDMNQGMGQGPNWFGQSWTYPEATYAERETIWKNHENYIRGLLYTWAWGRTNEGDTRVPVAVETQTQAFGLSRTEFLDPHENDEYWWPGQLYVRSARRLVGDVVHTATMMGLSDGTTPASTKTIAVASYPLDPHHAEDIADPNAGTPRVWHTGMFVKGTGATDQMSPLPYEIICPKATECTNLLAPFCVSANYVAFGSIRMEWPTQAMAQAAGLAAAIAIEDGVTVQNVSYTTLRSRLLASNTLTNEVDPVIPQVN
jgi:hypothetical protein